MVLYSDVNSKDAIDQIGDFDANYGGTELKGPTIDAFKQKLADNMQKRVFILTDGFADDKNGVL